MKFTVQSEALLQAATSVSKIINSKNALAILDNFLIKIADGVLTISGSDTENALSATVELPSCDGSGSLCLNARRLLEILKQVPAQGLSFDIDDTTLMIEVTYASGMFNLIGIPGDQYPEYTASVDSAEPIVIKANSDYLRQGFEYTMFAVGTDDYRPMMMGVLLDIKPESVIFVATDTRKLVRYEDKRMSCGLTTRVILPLKPASVFTSAFPKGADVTITISAKNARFECENMVMQCTFINGNYPDYDRVIPRNQPYRMTIDRQAFLQAVRRAGICTESNYTLEKFRITPERVFIKSEDTALGTSARDSVPCSFTGNELTIGFGADFLSVLLATLPTEEIFVDLSDQTHPGVFLPSENVEGTELVMLLMPMTVGEF